MALALDAVPTYIAAEGAVIWNEVEAVLSESDWLHEQYDPTIPPGYGLDPHILHRARGILAAQDAIVEDAATLNGRRVSAWLDVPGLATRRTEIERTAASKRRLYRSFLSWAGNTELCGGVAEEIVEASLQSLAGRFVWMDPSLRPGRVTSLLGRAVPVGGPLDSAGFAPNNPSNPSEGFVPFAVEVKNVRSVLYPWHHDVWDLLSKLATFPEVVPVLVARRIHSTTFRCFRDIGALGCQTRRQWFFNRGTARATIDPVLFAEACNRFGFGDAVLVESPRTAQQPITKFFSETIRADTPDGPLLSAQAERWAVTATIAEDFDDLRNAELSTDDRREVWREFGDRVKEAGLYDRGGWAPNGTDVTP